MSLETRIVTRLKAKFPGVTLSKRSAALIAERIATCLTEESADNEIDLKLEERNTIFSFEDQKKYDDYLAGKAAKAARDKETRRLETFKSAETSTDQLLKAVLEQYNVLAGEIASIREEIVTNKRGDQGTGDFIQVKISGGRFSGR